ncbi:MAG: arsenate reductase family protein [Lachnospiraceae bacterium]|nr:arsenate reductase family protein [Lachnospiraceae bacterium]
MNIQIFGTNKSFDTKKAMRYFKERNIPYQFVDLKEKGLSKGELRSVANAVGGLDKLINEKSKDTEALALIKYLSDEDKFEKVLENPKLLVDPVVRNGKQATAGYQPEVWKDWK